MSWDIPLQASSVTIGRNEDNTVVIDDPSISGAHCEVLVSDGQVTVKDLGSANGVRVDGELVDQVELQPGQVFQLGEVNLQYESSGATAYSTERQVMVANLKCKIHPRNFARYFCAKCDRAFCDLCVSSRAVNGRAATLCRACQSECMPVERPEEEVVPEKSLVSQMGGAFGYPWRGDGVYILVLGALMFSFIAAARYVMSHGFVFSFMGFLAVTVFGVGYLTAYMKDIITATAAGEDRPPDWPDLANFPSDITSPFFQMLGTCLACFAPALVMDIFIAFNADASDGTQWYGWCSFALVLLGGFYFPMAFTGVAMFDSLGALNPVLVIPSILRIWKAYLLAVVLLAVIYIVHSQLISLLGHAIHMMILPTIISNLVGMYLVMVEMRILGLMYRNKKEELGWFNR